MATSQRFRLLKRRLTELRRHFLPASFSQTGDYSSRQHDRAIGYRILVHAEIEAYLEDRVIDALVSSHQDWQTGRVPDNRIFSLVVHLCFNQDDNDDTTMSPSSELDKKVRSYPRDRVKRSVTTFVKKVASNHGIRRDNLAKLLAPIGIEYSDLDPQWLQAMDDFGKDRGEVAHKASGVYQSIDPKTEFDRVNALLIGLEKVDRAIGS